jgi:hypothetical protein
MVAKSALALAAMVAVDDSLMDMWILDGFRNAPPALQEATATIDALGRAVFRKSLDKGQT